MSPEIETDVAAVEAYDMAREGCERPGPLAIELVGREVVLEWSRSLKVRSETREENDILRVGLYTDRVQDVLVGSEVTDCVTIVSLGITLVAVSPWAPIAIDAFEFCIVHGRSLTRAYGLSMKLGMSCWWH